MRLRIFFQKKDQRRRWSSSGFTLVELLVAVAIFATSITIVYASLYTGIKVYHRTQAQLQANAVLDKVLDRLALELRNSIRPYAIMFHEGEDPIVGSSQKLSFFTLHNTYTDEGMQKNIARMTYAFSKGRLLKKRQIDEHAFLDNENFKEEVLLTDIQTFELRYLIAEAGAQGLNFSWASQWSCADQMPYGVLIKIAWRHPRTELVVEAERSVVIAQGALNCIKIE